MQSETIEMPGGPDQETLGQPAAAPGRRRRRPVRAAAGAAVIVLVGGATFYAGTQLGGTEAPPAESAPGGPGQPAQTSHWDQVVALNAAMDARDLDAMAALIAPGSPAERWLSYWSTVEATDVAAGQPADTDAGSTAYDEASGTVTTTYADGTTTVTKDYTTDGAGRIMSWSDEAGTPIADRLWTQNTAGTGAGQTVTITSAFLTSSGDLYVTADITGDAGSDIDWRPTYVGPDGVARQPAASIGPDQVVPGGTTKVAYVYEAAEFGGRLVYDAWNGDTLANSAITLQVQ
jgi:hypothetical protein